MSPQRAALALGIDPHLPPVDALKGVARSRGSLTMHKPKLVSQGPVLENSTARPTCDGLSRADLAPGRRRPLIGSGSIVVMRDPDSGWVRSIYRVQVHGKDRVTVQFDHQGRHGAISPSATGIAASRVLSRW